MSSEDWYRNKVWDSAVEEHFYSKLNRARTQREQYLVIQALTLAESHPMVTLRLINEYFESRKSEFEDLRALLAKANAFFALADFEKSVATYKKILDKEKEFPNYQTGAYLDYPYLVATQRIDNEFACALDVLEKNVDRLTFPIQYFKWHASRALINNDGVEAKKALDAAKIKKSVFWFHQNVGLVGKGYNKTIKQLCKICV